MQLIINATKTTQQWHSDKHSIGRCVSRSKSRNLLHLYHPRSIHIHGGRFEALPFNVEMWEIDTSLFICRIVIVYSDVLVWTFCIEWALYDVYLITFHLYIHVLPGTWSVYVCKNTWTVSGRVCMEIQVVHLFKELTGPNGCASYKLILFLKNRFPPNIIESSYTVLLFEHIYLVIMYICIQIMYVCVWMFIFTYL